MIPQRVKKKVLVILGPTSSGKSDLAVDLALLYGGEVISADSRQVYKGLDIASGKITQDEMKGVTHHLLDVADPQRDTFTVTDFVEHAQILIDDMHARGVLPIIAGGTMFYIDALVEGMTIPRVEPNRELRTALETKDIHELYTILKKKDMRRAEMLKKGPQRKLIRAIEVANALGSVPESSRYADSKDTAPYDVLKIGIAVERDQLIEKIHARTTKRSVAGMIQEARDLHEGGLSYTRMESLGLEYRTLAQFLQGLLNEHELRERIEINDRQYAKKQMNWWKRDKNIRWFPLSEYSKIKSVVSDFLNT